ncbi:MAG: hypothetical protein K6A92_09875 [Lachnospiraceae bacterium]|nr:hypothetical protein [Lachnospiraceae bacterium]
MKRSSVIICLIFILISVCLFPVVAFREVVKPSYNAFGKGATSGEDFYYLDTADGGTRLYVFDAKGKVRAVSTDRDHSAVDLFISDGKLYVLSLDSARNDEGGICRSYRILSYTQDLKLLEQTAAFELHAGEKAVDLNVASGKGIVSAVSTDGSLAESYAVTISDLVTLAKEQDEQADAVTPDSIYLEEAPEGRFIADAAFGQGTLHIRTDADAPEGLFAGDPYLKNALSRIHFSFGDRLKLSGNLLMYWIVGTLILLGILILGQSLFSGQTRMVYVGLILEVLMVFMIFLFYSGFSGLKTHYVKEAREDYAVNTLKTLAKEAEGMVFTQADDTWYESDTYGRLQRSINRFVSRESASETFYDAFAISTETGTVICSADGRNNGLAQDHYGNSSLWSEIGGSGITDFYDVSVPGKDFSAFAVTSPEGNAITFVGIIRYDAGEFDRSEKSKVIRDLAILFVIASGLILFVLWLVAADIKRFDKAISEVAVNGRSAYLKPQNPVGSDLLNMWNSLREIEKKIDKINYSSYKRYEAYFRFAPRNIEKILGKDSILDVENGDNVSLLGTLGIISNAPEEGADTRISELSGLLSFLKDHPDKEGVIVSDRDGLATVDMLFTDDAVNTQDFAVDYLRYCRESGKSGTVPSLFLYHGNFRYGVTGNEDQSRVFLLSSGSAELLKLAGWFRKQKLSIVVTEDVKMRETNAFDYRYIGYVNVGDNGRDIKLYEILDGCPKKVRELRLLYRNKFEEAIRVFYASDYYIARNAFSEILKNDPGDEIVRWYLFESERLLDSPPTIGSRAGAIHAD